MIGMRRGKTPDRPTREAQETNNAERFVSLVERSLIYANERTVRRPFARRTFNRGPASVGLLGRGPRFDRWSRST